jgi:hypothetical protein
MTQPAVNITTLDGALGVLPPSAGRLFALVGVSSSGPINTPATYARVKDIVATFGTGPLVEAAAHYVERYSRPVVLVRTESSGEGGGEASAVDSTATGTSVVTVAASPTPNDDYEIVLKFIVGGTRGVDGATYQLSLDGGRTFGPVTALGTATSIAVTGAGGVSLALAAGTFVAGDSHAVRTTAPLYTAGELGDALTALGATLASWEIVHVVGAIDATIFDQIELKIAGMHAAGKYRAWIGNVRMPLNQESEADYLASVGAAFAAKESKHGSLYGGAIKLTSSVNGRKYKRPVSFATAAREASVSEEINIADVAVGSLQGVSIRDVNGNPDEHDESINPGLDDARFAVLRTIDGYPGVYVNRPRLFSPDGSDFQLMPHRRVFNLALGALRLYFIRRLNKPILVSKASGLILESEALEIEIGATSAMAGVLLAKPKASGVLFALSRTDILLSTKTLTGSGRITPLAYPETINLDLGYYNPALQVQAV